MSERVATGIICRVWPECHHPELCQDACADDDLPRERQWPPGDVAWEATAEDWRRVEESGAIEARVSADVAQRVQGIAVKRPLRTGGGGS